ncbi:gasdermin [Phaeodactylibacter luteus]|uniref:Gasdermin bGSDM n=1 Tax=Phaeodactylibacter luteus TaxID=1564516 RepID=A0A5C6S626_9BACT|nr:hypothetical protein [Phaeodactylibacter luteus]TXB69451.1 hypothetical protein FRY97_01170 [Phaeodactylibacter luteus]
MSFFRICKNDITDHLRETFNAFPLRVPETRVKPLVVMGQKGSKIDFRGELQFLLKGDAPVELEQRESAMANAALDRSKAVSASFGLKILDGFLSGFGIAPSPVKASLEGVTEMSYSFTGAKRLYIDPSELGRALDKRHIDLAHPSMGVFRGSDPYRMLLVSDAIVSNKFTINIEKSSSKELEASLPELQSYLADADLSVKAESKDGRSITFEGPEYLTFAFSCLLLELHPGLGTIAIGETVKSKGAGEAPLRSPYAVLDEDEFEPGMIAL